MLLTWGPHTVCHGDHIYILYLYDQMWLVGCRFDVLTAEYTEDNVVLVYGCTEHAALVSVRTSIVTTSWVESILTCYKIIHIV